MELAAAAGRGPLPWPLGREGCEASEGLGAEGCSGAVGPGLRAWCQLLWGQACLPQARGVCVRLCSLASLKQDLLAC